MDGFVIITPGPSSFAQSPDGSLLHLASAPGTTADHGLFKDGKRMRGGSSNTAYGGLKVGVYGKSVYITSADNSLWLVNPSSPSGFTAIADKSDLDPDFVAQMDLGFSNEPI